MYKWVKNFKSQDLNYTKEIFQGFDLLDIEEVYKFHKTLPDYSPTPLVELKTLAKDLSVNKIWVKDESKRFGLNAFKVLGASYAMAKFLSLKLQKPLAELPFNVLISDEIKSILGDLTFVTATDGNHGRGVAWIATKLRQKSVVYMPKGSSQIRFDAIKNEGAETHITNMNYDDAVRLANENSQNYGWITIQDTAWNGYEDIPLWIMQGYTTIINEVDKELKRLGDEKPTHVFLQAGVGSFAGAIQGYLSKVYGESRPITIICEPHNANCIYESIKANDGKPHIVSGDLATIMAGLSCGEPNTISWKILRDYSDFSISCDDEITKIGMRKLAHPKGSDEIIISGESGAVGLGFLTYILENKEKNREILEALKLNENSKILCISTEGDTDKVSYNNIVSNRNNI